MGYFVFILIGQHVTGKYKMEAHQAGNQTRVDGDALESYV